MGLEWILGRLAEGDMEWIQLAQDMGRWRAIVNVAELSRSGSTELVFAIEPRIGNLIDEKQT
jgi:hypothetical protein